MKQEELEEVLAKVGYKLEKVTRFRNHDRIRVYIPSQAITITLTLKKHLEETPRAGLLGAILGETENKILRS